MFKNICTVLYMHLIDIFRNLIFTKFFLFDFSQQELLQAK